MTSVEAEITPVILPSPDHSVNSQNQDEEEAAPASAPVSVVVDTNRNRHQGEGGSRRGRRLDVIV
jgi:hypothetical protein